MDLIEENIAGNHGEVFWNLRTRFCCRPENKKMPHAKGAKENAKDATLTLALSRRTEEGIGGSKLSRICSVLLVPSPIGWERVRVRVPKFIAHVAFKVPATHR